MKTGFIGLGSMGLPMAKNLHDAGIDLIVYNRTASKAEPLKKAGVPVAKSAADIAGQSDLLITMVSNDEALLTLLYDDGVLNDLKEGAIHVDMSTISAELAREITEVHEEEGHSYVSAPVFGRPDMAEAGKLWVVAGGNSKAVAAAQKAFDAVGRATTVVSDEPWHANIIKIAGNFMIASMVEAFGETFALVEKSGVDKYKFLEVITNALFDVPIYKGYGKQIADERYSPALFKMKHGLKDVGLALEAAGEAEVPMPTAGLIHSHFLSGIARGWEDMDWSALAKVCASNAGIGIKEKDEQ